MLAPGFGYIMKQGGDENWVVYLLRCADGTFYCGCTLDLERRIEEHNAGKGAKYVRGRTPAVLVVARHGLTKSEAHRFEARVKRLPSKEKKAFVKTGEAN